VPFKLTKEQLELLVNHETDGLNLNEIDSLLEEIFQQSSDEKISYVSQILIDHYRREVINLLPRLDSPIILIAVAILVILIFRRSFYSSFHLMSRLTFSALIVLTLCAICVISYAMTYWDCLSDLEVEQMIQLSKKQSPSNPCKDYNGEHENVWNSMKAVVFGSSENKCLEHMRETFKPSKNYCDPLDVFAKWFGKIQMSYFNSIISSFLEVISKISSSSNFLTKIFLWIVSLSAFVFFIYAFGKVVLIQSFKGMFNVLNRSPVTSQANASDSNQDLRALSSKMDVILQENQEMKRELSIIREHSVERSLINDNTVEPKCILDKVAEETSEEVLKFHDLK
jgi:hypothetical protein